MFALLEVSELRYYRRGESVPQALAVSMIAFAIGRERPMLGCAVRLGPRQL
jgi:hypothetical protein